MLGEGSEKLGESLGWGGMEMGKVSEVGWCGVLLGGAGWAVRREEAKWGWGKVQGMRIVGGAGMVR